MSKLPVNIRVKAPSGKKVLIVAAREDSVQARKLAGDIKLGRRVV